MSPIDGLVTFFNNIDVISLTLWITGIVLFSLGFFRGHSWVMYALGGAFLLSSFVIRMLNGSVAEAYVFVLSTFVAIFITHTISLIVARKDWLKVARMRKSDAVTNKYQNFVGKRGIANTPIDLVGNVVVDDINLVVYSETPIGRGENVMIVEVKSDRIIVEKI